MSQETLISSRRQLCDLLTDWWGKEPGFYDLMSPGGDVLCLGLGGQHGCAMFATSSMLKEGGTLDGVADETASDNFEDDFEFDASGTATPVSSRYLLTLETILKVPATSSTLPTSRATLSGSDGCLWS